jgi:stress response protein YsnF
MGFADVHAVLALSDSSKSDADTKQHAEAASKPAGESQRLPLMAEEPTVAKERREARRVRVSTHAGQREALVDEALAHERIEIETVPVGRPVDRVPPVRHEGDTTTVPVVGEALRVERRLVLKQEVRIRRVRTTERRREKVALRHPEAVVTRQEAGQEPGASGSEKGSTALPAGDRKS